MNTTINYGINFKSTIIPKNASKPLLQYLDALSAYNLKSMSNRPVEDCYQELFKDLKQGKNNTGILMNVNDNALVRVLGNNIDSDQCIYRRLKKVDRNVTYEKDIPDDGLDHAPFEVLI